MSQPSRLRLKLAARRLQAGGIVAYPTEAVFGLGCDPRNAAAVRAIFELKQRPSRKGLILIAADLAQLRPYLAIDTQEARQKLQATWPGPVTWIIPAKPDAPAWLCGKRGTLAARVTAHGPAAALCRAFGGALISTSANPAGKPPAKTRLKTRRYFPRADLGYLPGSTGGLDRPTAIYDLRSGARLR
jgi:L-threonylcarbamoyladenylate synthase